jgi:hypothetical protein
MATVNRGYLDNLNRILKNLGIPKQHFLEPQIQQFLMYCHHKRLTKVTEQLDIERKRAQKVTSPSSRQQALLDPEGIWRITKSAYNQDLRDYGFLYLAFNLLEDSLRRNVDIHYGKVYKDDFWYKNEARYPNDVSRQLKKEGKLEKVKCWNNGHLFMDNLTFGQTIKFFYDQEAWSKHHTQQLFAKCQNYEDPEQTLPKLTRCEVYEKLTILQWRRNSVYHHNLISKTYTAPSDGICRPSQEKYSDGTFSNTRDRIYEMLHYLGLKPKYVMEQIVGISDTLPHLSIITNPEL